MAFPGPALAVCLALLLLAAPRATTARDRGADGRFSERGSSHFQLLQDVDIDRYSGPRGSRRFEREVLESLESAYRQVGDLIGVRPRSKLRVLIYDTAVFDEQFGDMFGFRAAGFFDGVIHVRGSTVVDTRLVRTLYHEYTHAALYSVAADGLFPGWLNEGLAEYFEALAFRKRHLSAAENAELIRARHSGAWIPLGDLSAPSFAHLGADAARLAYLEAYAAVEHLIRRHGKRRMRDLCEQLVRTRKLDRALERVYRRSLDEVEADLLRELR